MGFFDREILNPYLGDLLPFRRRGWEVGRDTGKQEGFTEGMDEALAIIEEHLEYRPDPTEVREELEQVYLNIIWKKEHSKGGNE